MPTKSTLAAVAALSLSLAVSTPALALCVLCNASVRLDDSLAACFAERADAELERLVREGKGFVIVDLGDCAARGSLPTGTSADAPPLPLDTQFVADAESLACLRDVIAATDDTAFLPSHVFDLATQCPAAP